MSDATAPNRKWMIAGLLIGLGFLWIALRQIDLTTALSSLRSVSIGWLLVVMAFGIVFIVIKTLRWTIILRPILGEKFNLLHQVVYIGTAANLVIAHTGELLRTVVLTRRGNVDSSAVLATIGLERTLDFVALLLLIGIALVFEPQVSSLLWFAGLISLGFIVVGVIVVLALLNPDSLVSFISTKLLAAAPAKSRQWLSDRLRGCRDGLISVRRLSTLAILIAISLFQWCMIVAAIWACSQAAGVSIPISGAIAVFALSVIGLTLPSSPAQLGTIQLAFVVGIDLVGGDAAYAFTASVVYVCFINLTMMLIGGACWLYYTSSWFSSPDNNNGTV